jgi:hypothetical protein
MSQDKEANSVSNNQKDLPHGVVREDTKETFYAPGSRSVQGCAVWIETIGRFDQTAIQMLAQGISHPSTAVFTANTSAFDLR